MSPVVSHSVVLLPPQQWGPMGSCESCSSDGLVGCCVQRQWKVSLQCVDCFYPHGIKPFVVNKWWPITKPLFSFNSQHQGCFLLLVQDEAGWDDGAKGGHWPHPRWGLHLSAQNLAQTSPAPNLLGASCWHLCHLGVPAWKPRFPSDGQGGNGVVLGTHGWDAECL